VREVEVEVGREGRSARVDGKPVRDPDELFGGLATVAFTPDDLAVVKGGPEGGASCSIGRPEPASRASRGLPRLPAGLRARNELLRQNAPPDLLAKLRRAAPSWGRKVRRRREEVLEETPPSRAAGVRGGRAREESLDLVYLAAGRDSDGLAAAEQRSRSAC